jgi:hypothetical protein
MQGRFIQWQLVWKTIFRKLTLRVSVRTSNYLKDIFSVPFRLCYINFPLISPDVTRTQTAKYFRLVILDGSKTINKLEN